MPRRIQHAATGASLDIPEIQHPVLLRTDNLPITWMAQAALQAQTKLEILLERLLDDAASYNRHIKDELLLNKTVGVLLVLEFAAIADFLKMEDYFSGIKASCLQRLHNETFSWIIKRGTKFHIIDMASSLALFVMLLVVAPQDAHIAVLGYCLSILARYHHLELQEEYALDYDLANPMRGHPTIQFTADYGHDCSIYQLESIGEAEWIYCLPCEHHFHKYCLAHWLSLGNDTCPLCRRILVQRTPELSEGWATLSNESSMTQRAFTDSGRWAASRSIDHVLFIASEMVEEVSRHVRLSRDVRAPSSHRDGSFSDFWEWVWKFMLVLMIVADFVTGYIIGTLVL